MLIDNKRTTGTAVGFLDTALDKGTGNFDAVTGFFTVSALNWLSRFAPKRYRLVLARIAGMDDGPARIVNLLTGKSNIKSGFTLSAKAKGAIAFLKRESVFVRTVDNAFCHAKAYIYKDAVPEKSAYLMGSSNLTESGLGMTRSANLELNIAESGEADKNFAELSDWFSNLWEHIAKERIQVVENGEKVEKSAKQHFIDLISSLFRDYTPLEIYYKILFTLFIDQIENSPLVAGKESARFTDSEIFNTLFKYQKRGAVSLINMLTDCNGAILADAVGLGKTFTALAVIKFFQDHGYTTVVFCPKKLEQNWTQYQYLSGSRFERDAFHYEVRFHTDLQDERLETNYSKLKMSYINTLGKLLFVIDESHNLRNDKSSRYQYFVERLLKANPSADIKVLELSATPVNNRLADVRNQFKLFVRGADDGFDDPRFDSVASLEDLFGVAQKAVEKWLKMPNRKIADLVSTLPPKFFNLTDRLIVARTRAMVERTEGVSLGFPKKNKPVNVYLGISDLGALKSFEQIKAAMLKPNLVAYMPAFYTDEKKVPVTKDERQRQFFLVKMMGMLFAKRLESSWHSFDVTLSNVLAAHENALKKAEDFQKFRTDSSSDGDTPSLSEEEREELENLSLGKKNPIRFSQITKLDDFITDLKSDIEDLKSLKTNIDSYAKELASGTRIDPKLEKLKEILRDKKAKCRKVIVFTTYTDTAAYIYNLLKTEFPHIARVDGEGATSPAPSGAGDSREKSFQSVLRRFAPQSKLYRELDWSDDYRAYFGPSSPYFDEATRKWKVPFVEWRKMVAALAPSNLRARDAKTQLDAPIDILVATDCISEGQNLQDAQTVINYDIHWNPVRIVQRLGRIDRIHSPNEVVDCVNFWPASDYEDYIRLYQRIDERFSAMTLVGAEIPKVEDAIDTKLADNPILTENESKLLKSLADEKLPDDGDDDGSFGLHDLSLEDFRQDLMEYLQANRAELEKIPNGAYSGFRAEDDLFFKVPASVVALVASPCREDGVENHRYERFKLLLRPVNDDVPIKQQPAISREFNRKEILSILAHYKKSLRMVPPEIDAGDENAIAPLRHAIVGTMEREELAKEQHKTLFEAFNGDFDSSSADVPANIGTIEEGLDPDKWDLITWEIISK